MKTLYSLLLVVVCQVAYGQFDLSAELRPRFEYRHGYKTLFPDNADPAAFVSQRARINTAFKQDNLSFYLSAQDIRVWGDVPQLNSTDNNGTSIHQVWGKINTSEHSAFKLGRQVISYDDQRIFGEVGWAQQARSHDALLYQYAKNKLMLDAGVTYNQSGENVIGNTLNTSGTYKTLQYVWMRNQWDKLTTSFLILNNGLQYIDNIDETNNETRFSQTIGSHLKYNNNQFKASGNAYYQLGNDVNNRDVSAYLLGLELDYTLPSNFSFGGGVELQSGNDNGVITDNKNKAFTPFYGTNHKFNGYMDYFYVGNHFNNIGLLDIHLRSGYKVNDHVQFNLTYLNFSSAAEWSEKKLGSEVDLTFDYKVQKNVSMSGGYSQLFATDGMRQLKGTQSDNTNNWAWLMVTIDPKLLSITNK